MIDISKHIEDLENLRKTMNWLISGLGRHGLQISDVKHINWQWVCENYNVENNLCKHKQVEDIGYVVTFGDVDRHEPLLIKSYDGFCCACNRKVYASTTLNNEHLQPWTTSS
jgi:hypothetical protein